ncbi:MAG: GntR family transcriptional regulator [Pseudonocardiaceae bacterium]
MDLEPPKARYRQVADHLREAIHRGEYVPGELLPSQPELARQYGLNQTSISRAISILRNEGLVRIEQGRGAFVQEMPTVRRIRRIPPSGDRDSSFATEMRRLRLDPKTDLVQTAVARAPAQITERLGIPEDGDVLIRTRHMYASGLPVQLATSYIPIDIASGREVADPDTNPAVLYERLAARGHRATHFVEEIEVRRPTTDEADFLQLSEGQPVIVVVRLAHDQHGRVMDVAVNVLSGYQWRLVYEWDSTTSA